MRRLVVLSALVVTAGLGFACGKGAPAQQTSGTTSAPGAATGAAPASGEKKRESWVYIDEYGPTISLGSGSMWEARVWRRLRADGRVTYYVNDLEANADTFSSEIEAYQKAARVRLNPLPKGVSKRQGALCWNYDTIFRMREEVIKDSWTLDPNRGVELMKEIQQALEEFKKVPVSVTF